MFTAAHISYPVQVVDPGQVLHDRSAAQKRVQESVPEQNELAAKLGDVAVGHGQKLVLSIHRL